MHCYYRLTEGESQPRTTTPKPLALPRATVADLKTEGYTGPSSLGLTEAETLALVAALKSRSKPRGGRR